MVQRKSPPPMVAAQYRGKFCHRCWMQVTALPWTSTAGNTHPVLTLQPMLLRRAHTQSEVFMITRQEMLVVWFSVHYEVMPVRHSPQSPGEYKGQWSRLKAHGLKVLVFEGSRAKGGRAEGTRAEGVGVCVCVWGMKTSTVGKLLHQSVNLLLWLPRKSWQQVLDIYQFAGQNSPQEAAGLRASYNRRSLHVVKPLARWGRDELRVSTPPHFRAASEMTDAGAVSKFSATWCKCMENEGTHSWLWTRFKMHLCWCFEWWCIQVNAQGVPWVCRCVPVNSQGDQWDCVYYEQCPKNSFKRLYIVKGLLVLVEKTFFRKNFNENFNAAVEKGT